eukprot:2265926-Rhodomonas_salina.2
MAAAAKVHRGWPALSPLGSELDPTQRGTDQVVPRWFLFHALPMVPGYGPGEIKGNIPSLCFV